ncbi:FAD-linked oxidase C-terminal domain-containing protein [Neptunicella marina]|uniref:D-lactate dehydrogenase (cytochrome) n=1 Tax=Neptunicella marina TaxID=2125989 RepID=A0A8J6IU43_9ALTE|nr:FAD-binding oxidoreductase [Neptunicella marina]
MSTELSPFDLFVRQLKPLFASRDFIDGYLQRYAYGTDASFYRLIPQLVLRVDSIEQLSQTLKAANRYSVPVTFRAAGTSLSGQAITDSVLIVLSSQWRGMEVLDNGHKIRLQPGVIGADANKALLPLKRKIGPDPASINACKIGGIAANNSSGMCCGTKHNSYHTLAAMKVVLADGTFLDTGCEQSRAQFRQSQQTLLAGINNLQRQLQQQPQLVERVRHKYRLKNTTGYGVNALLDFSDPIDVLSHLMIGSEGTLAFIADITYNTVPLPQFSATGLYVFNNMQATCKLVSELARLDVDAVEIMDARALNSVHQKLQNVLGNSGFDADSAALLIEFGATDETEFLHKKQQLEQCISGYESAQIASQAFSQDRVLAADLWQIRKGMFPAVGAVREAQTTVIIEDIAVPIEQLAEGVAELQQLFIKYDYHEAIIFGHALAGNLHFVFTQAFNSDAEIKRYEQFMAEVAQLVAVKYQGSLKAEHGTGRNMAPFVELEWGTDIYQFMRELKSLFDPNGVLNPGVLINDDPDCHLHNLKTMPQADEQIDSCIECGFCEPVCPSKDLTLTPRQRISLWRRRSELSNRISLTLTEQHELKDIDENYQHFGIDSCAATGLCATQCPVGIDTGAFVKSVRAGQVSATSLASSAAKHFDKATAIARFALNGVNVWHKVTGDTLTRGTFSLLNKVSAGRIPNWHSHFPKGADIADKFEHSDTSGTEKVVYISACANRMFAPDPQAKDQRSIQSVLASVLDKAGIELLQPEKVNNLCCGMPWDSKGYTDIANNKQQQLQQQIELLSDNGKWPVVMDASPCSLRLQQPNIKVYELSEYLLTHVLNKLDITPTDEKVMLHKTCSSLKLDNGTALQQLAQKLSNQVIVPEKIYCCGFAGDKGFSLPELNDAALSPLKAQVPEDCSRGISNSRSCEIGLAKNAGVPYQSVLYLLDEVSMPRN